MLETAFDQISNPVAFAAAPLDVERVGKKPKDKDKEKGKGKESDDIFPPEPTSPLSADSFEVVHKKAVGTGTGTGTGVGGKTPEELALENEHLRASLDALSKHTMQVEQELKRLKDREGMMKSVVLGVKAEAQKVMQSQVLSRSQMPGASRVGFPGFNGRVPDLEQRRVVDLEEQVKFLQAENERAVCQALRLSICMWVLTQTLISLGVIALALAKIQRQVREIENLGAGEKGGQAHRGRWTVGNSG